MKTVKAFQNSAGTLFVNRDDYVRAEIAVMLPATPDSTTEKNVESVMSNREKLLKLLAIRKKRGPNKPKAVA